MTCGSERLCTCSCSGVFGAQKGRHDLDPFVPLKPQGGRQLAKGGGLGGGALWGGLQHGHELLEMGHDCLQPGMQPQCLCVIPVDAAMGKRDREGGNAGGLDTCA